MHLFSILIYAIAFDYGNNLSI